MTQAPQDASRRQPATGRPVYLHIGAPKSGTTYLQRILWSNRVALRADGMLYPGAEWPDHVFAALGLRGVRMKGHDNPRLHGAFRRLADEIEAFDGPGVISHELFSGAGPAQIRRAVDMLSFGDVHVVYTLRDMARTIPAAWQEWIKNRELDSFAEFLDLVRSAPAGTGTTPSAGRTAHLFWNLHDTTAILRRWAEVLSPQRIHVITVPAPGAPQALMWERFAGLLGLDAHRYDLGGDGANSSLAAPEAAVLRRFNEAIGGSAYAWPVYDRVIKHDLANLLAARPGPAIGLPADDFDWAVRWSQDTANEIAEAGYDVVGDLSELIPDRPRPGIDPDHAPAGAQLDAAVVGMAHLAQFIASGGDVDNPMPATELQARLDLAEQKVAEHRALPPGERVKRCAVELSGQVTWLGVLYEAYRRVRQRPPARAIG